MNGKMSHVTIAFTVVLLVSVVLPLPAAGQDVIITEIMYNPSGTDGSAEWVEIHNTAASSVDISGWYLDDGDGGPWGPVAGSTTLPAGDFAVLFDSSATTAAGFRADWNVPAGSLVCGVGWDSLSNSGENLTLRKDDASSSDDVTYDDGGDWPVDDGFASIYLHPDFYDGISNDLGANWLLSTVGVHGAGNPNGNVYTATDIGSPGRVPEPATTSLLALGGVAILRRRRR